MSLKNGNDIINDSIHEILTIENENIENFKKIFKFNIFYKYK